VHFGYEVHATTASDVHSGDEVPAEGEVGGAGPVGAGDGPRRRLVT